MNPNNYTSLELSQHLVAAGIVLKTDFYHETHGIDCYELVTKEKRDVYLQEVNRGHVSLFNFKWIPAANLSELLRELPIEFIHDTNRVFLFVTKKRDRKTYCGYAHNENAVCNSVKSNTNSCDALAELLIWVKGEKEHELTEII